MLSGELTLLSRELNADCVPSHCINRTDKQRRACLCRIMLLLEMTVQYVVQRIAASLNMLYSNHVYICNIFVQDQSWSYFASLGCPLLNSGARKALSASQPGRMRIIMEVSRLLVSIRVSTTPPCRRTTGRS